MGHSDNTMASHYREPISDDRLEAVAEHVRKELRLMAKDPGMGKMRLESGVRQAAASKF